MDSTISRLRIISEIFRDIAQVFFASAFVGPVISGDAKALFTIGGLLLSVMFWYMSVALIGEG